MLRTLALFALTLTAPLAQAKRIPDLEFKDLAGHTEKLSSLQGSIAVISFWATWCAPCREELPRLSHLSRDYTPKGVHFLAISADSSKDKPKIEPFLHQQNLALEVWLGASIDTLDRLNLGNALPATIILDENGEIIGRIEGEAQPADITSRLDWLLNHRQGASPEPLTKHLQKGM